ncbi:MAG: hypothetical protein ACLFQB_14035 [Chitinispirillaceae bacterium]
MSRLLKTFLLVAGLTTSILASTSAKIVQDSMDGNWPVINGQKRFISGMNIAWLSSDSFGNDVGDSKINMNSFLDKVKKIRRAGGNALRWWLHTDASNCPKIDENGEVTGLGSKTISNMRAALDTAHAYGVVVSMCLFSFDMLVPGTKSEYREDYNLENNHKFLTIPENIDTYLENGLKPIMDSVGSHPAVLCWEVFNEAEGMLESAGWSHVEEKITQEDILRITNRIAGFVHRNSTKMASTGIASFEYVDEYSDESLAAAGGDEDGYLDFYMGHYYPEWQDESISPFHNPASHWNMDRPILIGEFPAKDWSSSTTGPSSGQPLKTSKTIVEAFEHAYDNGYAGALSWAMTEGESSFFGDYSTTAPALENLFEKYQDDIMIKDVVIEEMTGNHAMRLALTDLPTPDDEGGDYYELGTSCTQDFTGKENLTFQMYIEEGSETDLQIVPVIKVTDAWTWSPAEDEGFTLDGYSQGEWVTVTIPLSAFGASDLSEVVSILFQYWALDSEYTGTIYIDDISIDGEVIYDFDTEGSAWATGADNAHVSLFKVDELTSPVRRCLTSNGNAVSPMIKTQGKIVTLNVPASSDVKLQVTDLKGKTVADINCGRLTKGTHSFNLSGLPSGHYILQTHQNETVSNTSVILP